VPSANTLVRWVNENAFAYIVQARPCPTFGRPVHLRGSPHRLQPGTSPHALRIPPRDGHPALRVLRSGGSRSALVCFRLSPSCPCRPLHTFLSSRPARNYPRFWIQRSSSERRRDFNPPEQRAAQRTLWPSPRPKLAATLTVALKSPPPASGFPQLRRLPSSTCRAHYPGGSIRFFGSVHDALPHRAYSESLWPSLNERQVGIHNFPFEACSSFTRVTACGLAHPPYVGFVTRLPSRRLTRRNGPSAIQSYRQLLEWDFHPLVICAFGAHVRFAKSSRRTPSPPPG
jgi:hypothetical protein